MSRPKDEAAADEQPPRVKKSKKRKRLLLEANAEQSVKGGDNNLTKALGSPDYQTRDQALMVLTQWLSKRPSITDSDLNKIWKGLFYTFWHSDKQPVQEALAERLALILPQLQPKVAFAYWAAFMETLRREWFGIDRLRLDKFMMLTRKFVQQTFEHLHRLNWAVEEVARFSSQLAEAVLLNGDASPDLGFVFHLSDCWVPELLDYHELQRIPGPALDTLLAPFTQLLAHCDTAIGIVRVTRGAFEPLLDACEVGVAASPPADASFLHDLADSIFAAGASEGVRVKNREALYGLSRRIHKAADKAPASLSPHQKQQRATSGKQHQQLRQKEQRPSPAMALPVGSATSQAQQASKAQNGGTASRGRQSRLQSVTSSDASDLMPAGIAELAVAGVEATQLANGFPEATDEQGDASVSTAKRHRKKKQQQAATAAVAADAEVETPPAGRVAAVRTVKGSSSGRAGSQAVSPSSTRMQSTAALAAVTGSSQQISQRQSRTKSAAAKAAAEAVTAVVGSPATPAAAFPDLAHAAASSKRKSVQFLMKKNLYFEHGGPLLPPEVRTPPGVSRFPGSALRAGVPATEPTRRRLHGTPGRARPGRGTPNRGGKGRLKSPKSIPRSKAAAFF